MNGPRLGFPRSVRLLRRVDYEAVYGAGQRRSSPQFAIFFRAQQTIRREPSVRRPAAGHDNVEGSSNETTESLPDSRFGISVKKALGGAVVRNRIRRPIREILRCHRMEIPSGWDIVIHPKRSVEQALFAPLEAELLRLLRGLQEKRTSPPAVK